MGARGEGILKRVQDDVGRMTGKSDKKNLIFWGEGVKRKFEYLFFIYY